MQTYKTVEEIVDFLETYHQQLHDYFLKYRNTVNSDKGPLGLVTPQIFLLLLQ
ncbi:MAG: hypothetical protein LC657_08410 [Desulfobacteraceae bacterium]|nr:hypothetical protein [Desulfobacteraceae bacterium]